MDRIELLVLDRNTWNHLTVCKEMSFDLFKNVTSKLFTYKSYTYLRTHTHTHALSLSLSLTHTHIYIYMFVCVCIKKLALNNQHVLMCHKTNETNLYPLSHSLSLTLSHIHPHTHIHIRTYTCITILIPRGKDQTVLGLIFKLSHFKFWIKMSKLYNEILMSGPLDKISWLHRDDSDLILNILYINYNPMLTPINRMFLFALS